MNNNKSRIKLPRLSKEDSVDLVHKKIKYFFDNKLPIHFCIVNSPSWKNGYIKSIDPSSHSFILNEFREGEIPVLFEEIYLASIKVYKTKQEMGLMDTSIGGVGVV